MKRVVLMLVVLLIVVQMLAAGTLTIRIGRVQIIAPFNPAGADMMSWLGEAGNSRVEAEERVSIVVQEYCTALPDRCAELGISVLTK